MLILARFVHIAIAAAWFGHKLLIPFDLREIGDAPKAEAISSLNRLKRAETLGKMTGVGTLVSGLWLVFLVGQDSVGPGIYAGLAFVVIAIGIGALVARPASDRLRTGVETNQPELSRSSAHRLSQVLVAESALWSAALIAMVI